MGDALLRHNSILQAAIEDHAGYVFAHAGDGVAAAFEHCDEAMSAALDAQQALASERWPTSTPLRVRMGLHTGEALNFNILGALGAAQLASGQVDDALLTARRRRSHAPRRLADTRMDARLRGVHGAVQTWSPRPRRAFRRWCRRCRTASVRTRGARNRGRE
jgi:class 3 adenylate cyclase